MPGLLDMIGLGGVANGLLGGEDNREYLRGLFLTMGGHDQAGAALMGRAGQRAAGEQFNAGLNGYFGGQPQPMPQTPASTAPMMPQSPNYGGAIASIESGGKYDAMGPVTKTGDRAYGKYQVMGANIGPWSKQYLGQELTPQQFLSSPEAQDKVFQGKFGEYVQQHGPQGAAKAWFAGERGMHNPNARDQLSTTVSAYADKFNRALGPQAGQRFASAEPLTPMDNSTGAPAMAPPTSPEGPVLGQPRPMQTAQAAPQQPTAVGAAPQGQPAVSPKLVQAMKLMTIQNLPKAQFEIAQKLFHHELDQSKLTDQQKNYLRAKVDPGFADFNRPPEMKMLKDPLGNDVPYTFNPNSQALTPLNVPAAPEGGKAPIELVTKLRQEVLGLPEYKTLSAAAPIYRSMEKTAANNSRVSDLNLVTGLAKMFDPTGVVREGDVIMVKNTAGMPEWLVGAINSLNGGAALTKQTRSSIMTEAHNRIQSLDSEYRRASSQYQGLAGEYRINPAHVVPGFGDFKKWEGVEETPGDRVNKWINFGNSRIRQVSP